MFFNVSNTPGCNPKAMRAVWASTYNSAQFLFNSAAFFRILSL
jgi:hypothetical protein